MSENQSLTKMRRPLSLGFWALLVSDLFALTLSQVLGFNALVIHGDYFGRWQKFSVWWKGTGEPHFMVAIGFCLFCFVSFQGQYLYSKRRPFWDELQTLLRIIIKVAALHGVVVVVSKLPFTRVAWLISWLAAAVLVPFLRSVTRSILRRLGAWEERTVILGQGANAKNVALALNSEAHLGYQIEALIEPGPHALAQLQQVRSRHLIIALDESEMVRHLDLVNELILRFPEIQFAPSLTGLPLFGMETHYFFSHEVLLLNSRNNLLRKSHRFWKRVFDIVAASLIIVILSPVLLWVYLKIRSTGPKVVFAHPRVGLGGQEFSCYKFRSMVLNAEKILQELLDKDPVARAEWQDKMKLNNDPRVTAFGHFIRKTSLDELPQLWNVVRGDMSLVGPRPIVKKEIEKYANNFEFYSHVRPGITGLWQVSGRSDTDYKTRVYFDTWYVKNWTLWNDIAILFKTVTVVLKRKGAY